MTTQIIRITDTATGWDDRYHYDFCEKSGAMARAFTIEMVDRRGHLSYLGYILTYGDADIDGNPDLLRRIIENQANHPNQKPTGRIAFRGYYKTVKYRSDKRYYVELVPPEEAWEILQSEKR